MKRVLCITGLCSALLCYEAAVALCLQRMVTHQQIPAIGWALLVSQVSILWLAFRYFDYRVHLQSPLPVRRKPIIV